MSDAGFLDVLLSHAIIGFGRRAATRGKLGKAQP
jgi:hypothetical protein